MVFAVMMLAAFTVPVIAVMFMAVLTATPFAVLCLSRDFSSGVGFAARAARSAEIAVPVAAGTFIHFFGHFQVLSFQSLQLGVILFLEPAPLLVADVLLLAKQTPDVLGIER